MFDLIIQMQICLKKEKQRIGKYTAKLTFLWYYNFGDKRTPLHRNSMATIPKNVKAWPPDESKARTFFQRLFLIFLDSSSCLIQLCLKFLVRLQTLTLSRLIFSPSLTTRQMSDSTNRYNSFGNPALNVLAFFASCYQNFEPVLTLCN